MTRDCPEHMQTPLTPAEVLFLRALLRYGDHRYNWPSLEHAPLDRSLSTPAQIAAVRAAAQGASMDDAMLRSLAETLDEMRKICAACISDDLPPHEKRLFTPTEHDTMEQAYRSWNGDPHEYVPGVWHWRAARWMGYYAAKLRYLAQAQQSLAA